MMNYNYRQNQNPFDEVKRFFRQGSALSLLILANVVLWVFIQVIRVVVFFYNSPDPDALNSAFMHALALPAFLPALSLKPWTLLTYMFLHFDIWHILFNMLWLYWFGKIFLEFLPSGQLVRIYFLGGLSGGLVYIVAFNLFPVFAPVVPVSYALGASASVMAIVTAIAVYVPDYTIQLLLFGRLRILFLAAILFISDFFMIPSGNAGGHIAHIGGALFGALYIIVFRHFQHSVRHPNPPGFFHSFKDWFRRHVKTNRTADSFHSRPVSDEEYNLRKREAERKTDEILDKISKGGYDSLTKDEKEFLFKTSNKR